MKEKIISTSMKHFILKLFIFLLLTLPTQAAKRFVNLSIGTKTVHFTGEPAEALAINDQIPAPTLHFTEGDTVTIRVQNNLSEGTVLHWHGLLLPWTMDGVEGITQEPIQPGQTFDYKFTLKQSGTYWYHAHSGFQEQRGLYGAIVVDPLKSAPYKYDKDYAIVLSDWSDTDPEQIFANLKKKGDFYSPRFPIQPSLQRFITDYQKASPEERLQLEQDYGMMQQMRMSIFDFSDVAYDAFLLNGRQTQNPWLGLVKKGETVRLRFIGAGGSTRFNVKIPDTTMQVIHIQGNDVEPHDVDSLTISPGETTDVLVKILNEAPYIIYAESSDTLGAAVGALVTNTSQKINFNTTPKFPTPGPVMSMDHNMMDMDMDMSSTETSGTKYQDLKSAFVTNDPDLPVTEIKMDLYGYMGKYIWFINGLMEHETTPITIEPGKRYRLTFTNTSMMTHPMHLHGHFFILRNGHDAYDPLMHTIEVAPGATVVADFDANTSGQWFFHCHHLFHMMSGMARVFQYSTLKDGPQTAEQTHMINHPMGHPPHIHKSVSFDFGHDPHHNVQKFNLKVMAGWDYQKIQLNMEDAEIRRGKVEHADMDVFYWHSINEFWALKSGVSYVIKPSHKPYLQPGIGIEGVMPYFIETDIRSYLHAGSVKLDIQLSRDTQLTNRFFIKTGIRGKLASKTVQKDNIGQGLNEMEYILKPYWTLNSNVSFFSELNHTRAHGALKNILRNNRDTTQDTTLTFGVSYLH